MSVFSKSKITSNIPFGVLPKPKEELGGLPVKGTTGQKLVKETDEDFKAKWTDDEVIPGPVGPTGPPGSASSVGTVQWTAGEVIGSPRVVMLDAGLAKLFSQGVEATIGKAVAISRNSVVIGGLLTAVIAGELQSNGSFVTGQIYYAGASGSLTNSPPASGIFLRVGTARNSDVLVVEFSEPIMQG